MREPDDAVVERVRKGDTEAFAELVAAYRKPLYALVSGMTGENDESEDLTQTCFVEAFRRLGELRDEKRFGPWLYAIARNRCRDWIRQQSRQPALVGDPSRLQPAARPELPTSPRSSAFEELQREAVETAVASLPPEYRAVVTLRYVGELSYAEIAQATGASVSAVAMRWHRARKMLKERLRLPMGEQEREERQ